MQLEDLLLGIGAFRVMDEGATGFERCQRADGEGAFWLWMLQQQ
ncbi:hypothetical protein AF72_06380 [Xylella taiwanensis]|uniref:Uncharacterized protein n=1 Tax=Xylella taiwanensis TaxID=1444770 RepID=Z9JJH5_9GAMM|nr:hypothetical protein AF72_06380 [Xylella taiwanensis]